MAFLAITAGVSLRLIREAKPDVPIGPYIGALTQLKAREALLGQTNLPTWVFLGIGQVLPPGWDSGRIRLVSIHPPVGSTHIPRRDITDTRTYDAGLIASISSLDLDSAHVYLSVHEEMDGLGDVHGTPEEFGAFYAKIGRVSVRDMVGSRRGREREGCGRTVRQFAPIARGLPDVLRRRVTHPGSLTGSAKWVRGASRALLGAVLWFTFRSSLPWLDRRVATRLRALVELPEVFT